MSACVCVQKGNVCACAHCGITLSRSFSSAQRDEPADPSQSADLHKSVYLHLHELILARGFRCAIYTCLAQRSYHLRFGRSMSRLNHKAQVTSTSAFSENMSIIGEDAEASFLKHATELPPCATAW